MARRPERERRVPRGARGLGRCRPGAGRTAGSAAEAATGRCSGAKDWHAVLECLLRASHSADPARILGWQSPRDQLGEDLEEIARSGRVTVTTCMYAKIRPRRTANPRSARPRPAPENSQPALANPRSGPPGQRRRRRERARPDTAKQAAGGRRRRAPSQGPKRGAQPATNAWAAHAACRGDPPRTTIRRWQPRS